MNGSSLDDNGKWRPSTDFPSSRSDGLIVTVGHQFLGQCLFWEGGLFAAGGQRLSCYFPLCSSQWWWRTKVGLCFFKCHSAWKWRASHDQRGIEEKMAALTKLATRADFQNHQPPPPPDTKDKLCLENTEAFLINCIWLFVLVLRLHLQKQSCGFSSNLSL